MLERSWILKFAGTIILLCLVFMMSVVSIPAANAKALAVGESFANSVHPKVAPALLLPYESYQFFVPVHEEGIIHCHGIEIDCAGVCREAFPPGCGCYEGWVADPAQGGDCVPDPCKDPDGMMFWPATGECVDATCPPGADEEWPGARQDDGNCYPDIGVSNGAEGPGPAPECGPPSDPNIVAPAVPCFGRPDRATNVGGPLKSLENPPTPVVATAGLAGTLAAGALCGPCAPLGGYTFTMISYAAYNGAFCFACNEPGTLGHFGDRPGPKF